MNKNVYIRDEHSMIIERLGGEIRKRYVRNENESFRMYGKSNEKMIEFGKGDLVIMKESKKEESYMREVSYETNGNRDRRLQVKRIQVYQMYESETMKEERRKKEEKENEELSLKKEEIRDSEIIKLIEEESKQTMKEIIFSSEINEWGKGRTSYDRRMKGRENVVIIIETELKTEKKE